MIRIVIWTGSGGNGQGQSLPPYPIVALFAGFSTKQGEVLSGFSLCDLSLKA